MEMHSFFCQHFPSGPTLVPLLKCTTHWKNLMQDKRLFISIPGTWRTLPSSGELKVWQSIACPPASWSQVQLWNCVRTWDCMGFGPSLEQSRAHLSAITTMTTTYPNVVSMRCPKNTARSSNFTRKESSNYSLTNVKYPKQYDLKWENSFNVMPWVNNNVSEHKNWWW